VPRLTDDGQSVALDLHGCRVDEALDLARAALRMAAARGRRRLDLIHGGSTTDGHTRTIKSALHDWADASGPSVQSVQASYGTLALHLDLAAPVDPARLTLRDVMR
jgi:DNA-nicking Smr family endonuclease